MSEKKKVLIVNDVLQYGGSDLVAVRLQQNLDKEKFECVYCVRHSYKGSYEPQLEKTGVRIIHQPDEQLGYIKSYKFYKNLFKKEHFDIVHSHLLFYSGLVLLAAKKCGIKKRVAHSHFSQPLELSTSKLNKIIKVFYHFIMRLLLVFAATDIIGCSKACGEYLAGKRGFAKKGIVLNNGIETEKYAFDKNIRKSKRQELGIDDKIVLGHIGQMYYVKNHDFLIDVFYDFQKENPDSVLLLISDGQDRKKLENKVASLKISDKVKFLGFRNDIPELLMAMDCFVFPSIHEGFPLTLIEAQMDKLPCVVSDTITNKVRLTDCLTFVPIDKGTTCWCKAIKEYVNINREETDISKVISAFSIEGSAKKLEDIFMN